MYLSSRKLWALYSLTYIHIVTVLETRLCWLTDTLLRSLLHTQMDQYGLCCDRHAHLTVVLFGMIFASLLFMTDDDERSTFSSYAYVDYAPLLSSDVNLPTRVTSSAAEILTQALRHHFRLCHVFPSLAIFSLLIVSKITSSLIGPYWRARVLRWAI